MNTKKNKHDGIRYPCEYCDIAATFIKELDKHKSLRV